MLLQQAKAIPARRNALRKNSKKLPRRRDTRSHHTVVKINKCPHDLRPLADAAKAVASLTQAPPAMAAQSVLAAATLATQAHGDVKLPHGAVRAGSGNLNSWDKWIFCLTAA